MKKKKFIFEKKVSEAGHKLSWGLSDPRKSKFRSKEDFMPGGKSGPSPTDYNWSTDTETDKSFDMKDMEQMQRAYNQEKEYQALSPLKRMFTSRPDSFRKGTMDQDFYWNQARSDDAIFKKNYSPTGVEGGKPAAPGEHYINKADIKDVTTPLSKSQLAAFGMGDNWKDKVAKAGMEDDAQDEFAGRDPKTNWTAAKRMASKKLPMSQLPQLEMDEDKFNWDDHGDFIKGLRGPLEKKAKSDSQAKDDKKPVSDYWKKWIDKKVQDKKAKTLKGESVHYNFKKIQEGMINGYGFTGESHDEFVARMSETTSPDHDQDEKEHNSMPGTRGIDTTIPNRHSDTAREKDDGDFDEYDLFDLEGHLGKAHVVGTDGQDKVLKMKVKSEGVYRDVDFDSREGFTMSLSNVINEKKFKDRKRDYRKIGSTKQEQRINDAFEGYPESHYYRRVIKEGDKFVLYVSRKDKAMTKTKYPKDLYDFANKVMENHQKDTKKTNGQ